MKAVAAPLASTELLLQLLVYGKGCRVHGSSDVGPETRRLQLLCALGLWAALRHSVFATDFIPRWRADPERDYILHLFSNDALHLFTDVGRLTETVEHLTYSPLPSGMGLQKGLTAYFKEERGFRVPLLAPQHEFDWLLEAVSLASLHSVAGLPALPGHGHVESPKRP